MFLLIIKCITLDAEKKTEHKESLIMYRLSEASNMLQNSKNRLSEDRFYHLVKISFPVVIYRCESWSIKKVEHQSIDAFKLWCWRRLLRVP